MSAIEKQTVELTCPGCQREMEPTYYDICSRREAKCRRCGSMLKFNSSAVSYLRSALNDLVRAQEKVGKYLEKAVETADAISKR
jgi:transcription initiation factor IIE alpha subunit